MNVFYEEDGGFKVATVLADNAATLQVEAPHGKRSKIKSANVLVRFEQPAAAGFAEAAQRLADDIDADFLWECCGSDEFFFGDLGREYFGHAPSALEGAALLVKLHSAPMYFYKRGKGRYKAAPADALKAALASVEKKRLQAEQKQGYIDDLTDGRLPAEFVPLVATLLYAPDKNTLEWKALEAASLALKLAPAQVLARCGAIADAHDYHLNRFLFMHFPDGTALAATPALAALDPLPVAQVEAFSIDDATTTEIDDAFSVVARPEGGTRVGIHIAAPALGVTPGGELDAIARARLSTVYFPGMKITMLPEPAIAAFSLAAGSARPALSLYIDLDAAGAIVGSTTRCELVPVAANLRHRELEECFNPDTLAAGIIEHRFGGELATLWHLAGRLQAARGRVDADNEARAEYSFYVEDGLVSIVQRARGTPVDKVVAELMIYANTEWGRELAAKGRAGIYRAQSAGSVRMTTSPAPHEGLGVAQYAWASSPLRRYIDLINQRQLLAMLADVPPPYTAGDEALLMALREFELAHEAYSEFQRTMERYWCLQWLIQERKTQVPGTVIRDNLVRLDVLPLVVRVPSLRDAAPGERVLLAVGKIDLWELAVHLDFEQKVSADQLPANRSPIV